MKKLITRFVSMLALTAISASPLYSQGCPNMVNIATNPEFTLGNTGFASSVPFNPALCTSNGYIVNANFQNKCGGWPNVTDHTTGAGLFMMMDGPTGAGVVTVWSQTVNVCPNTNYTFSYWGRNVYTINLFPVNFVINGATFAAANLAGGAWNQYSTVWNSGTVSGPITIALSIASGGAYRDFGIDDIFFGYCNNFALSAPPTICSGSCATLTASGAANYTWSTGATTASIVVCPGTTTSYSVTGTDATGCINYGTLSTTVTVNPSPTVTATASPSTLTPPTTTTTTLSATVTGGSGATFSWSPSSTLNSSTIATPIATPTTTTVYTVTVTNSNGCTGTATVLVTVAPQSLCTLPYTYDIPAGQNASTYFPSMSGVTGADIHISGVFTVDVSFNFGGCNIVMEPNSRIEVGPGVLLLITNNTHIYACDSMWDGINLQNGSNIQIMNAAVIEDAISAVTINQGSTAIIDHCIFNRNYTAVELTANTAAVSPLAMTNCVVTCRNITFNANPSLNPSSSTVWTNIVAGTYATINMKWPFFSYKSIYGVKATDVNMLQVGNASSSGIFNGFDNMMAAGIHSTRTNTIVYNNKFRSITSMINCMSCTPLIGTAVYGAGSTTSAYGMKVGGNLANEANDFYNVNTSVDVVQYTTSIVLYNTITNTSSTTALFGGYGKVGVRITPAANNTVNVSNNAITNCATGIVVNRNNTTASQTVSLTIDDNDLTANSTGFCNTAISVTDPSSGVTLIPTVSEVNFNVVIEAGTCINLSNVKSKNNVYYNSCMTRYAASGNINGIKLTNCQNQNVQQNHTKYNVGGTNILAYGIFLTNSAGNRVACNTIEDATRSLVFSGNCVAPHAVLQNTFRRAQDGMVLLTSTTDIGPQGTSVFASDNYWDMTIPMTQIVNVSTIPLVLYVTPGGPVTAVTQPTVWTGPVSITTITGYSPAPCGSVPARFSSTESTEATETMLEPIGVFPNPNNGQFTITANGSGPKDIMIYDMNGRLVFSLSQTTETTISVDISAEAKGLYVVQVIAGDEIQSARISNQ